MYFCYIYIDLKMFKKIKRINKNLELNLLKQKITEFKKKTFN